MCKHTEKEHDPDILPWKENTEQKTLGDVNQAVKNEGGSGNSGTIDLRLLNEVSLEYVTPGNVGLKGDTLSSITENTEGDFFIFWKFVSSKLNYMKELHNVLFC